MGDVEGHRESRKLAELCSGMPGRTAVCADRLATFPPADDKAWSHVLTDAELTFSRGLRDASAHLVARWLAKQAAVAVLGIGTPLSWQDIGVRRRILEPPRIALTGEYAERHRRSGATIPSVSMTHAAGRSAALAWLPR